MVLIADLFGTELFRVLGIIPTTWAAVGNGEGILESRYLPSAKHAGANQVQIRPMDPDIAGFDYHQNIPILIRRDIRPNANVGQGQRCSIFVIGHEPG